MKARAKTAPSQAALIDLCVDAARAYLDAHLGEPVTLHSLSKHVGVSPFHLQKAFKARIGLSPKAYLSARRVEQFKQKVANRGATVTRAIYEAGFGSPRGLYERANAALGMTPAAYRRGGSGVEIRYSCARCPLGVVLVGVTERGVCAVFLGDSAGALEQQLRQEFPHAARIKEKGELKAWVAQVIEHIEGRSSKHTLPLDVRGTDFQRRVWAALQRIPRGQTRSYAELAQAVGQPTATRAVASACAANNIAVVIPCHRVVRSDGQLSGYRWGQKRKRQLLDSEKKAKAFR